MEISKQQIAFVFNKFLPNLEILNIAEFTSGHINATYLIETPKSRNYVLQRINSFVFNNAKALIENKVMLSEYLQTNEDSGEQLQFIRTPNGKAWFRDDENGYWNMSVYIEGSKTFSKITDARIAYEGGRLIGEFLNLTYSFDTSLLVEILPNFHQMSYRFEQFDTALQNANSDRLGLAQNQIHFANSCREEMHLLQNYTEAGKIKPRVTHNDTKISNVLFDTSNKGICMIDTDTVMLGIAHYDFGDAVRTFCNTAEEDEIDLEKVQFNMAYFQSLTKGFLEKMFNQLSDFEVSCLDLAGKTITFIMGLRMLTDFLNNDVYYKTSYKNHNLDRAKNQFKLVEEMDAYSQELQAIILSEYNRIKESEK